MGKPEFPCLFRATIKISSMTNAAPSESTLYFPARTLLACHVAALRLVKCLRVGEKTLPSNDREYLTVSPGFSKNIKKKSLASPRSGFVVKICPGTPLKPSPSCLLFVKGKQAIPLLAAFHKYSRHREN